MNTPKGLTVNTPTKEEIKKDFLAKASTMISRTIQRTDHLWLPDKIMVACQNILELRRDIVQAAEEIRTLKVVNGSLEVINRGLVKTRNALTVALGVMIILVLLMLGIAVWPNQ